MNKRQRKKKERKAFYSTFAFIVKKHEELLQKYAHILPDKELDYPTGDEYGYTYSFDEWGNSTINNHGKV